MDSHCKGIKLRKAGVYLRLKNVLIVVNNIDIAVEFYKEMFGLQVIVNSEGNVIMSEGLVLQEREVWEKVLKSNAIPQNNMTELYFEEANIEDFADKLASSEFEIEYVSKLKTDGYGRKTIRFYDPSGNLIEVGTPFFERE